MHTYVRICVHIDPCLPCVYTYIVYVYTYVCLHVHVCAWPRMSAVMQCLGGQELVGHQSPSGGRTVIANCLYLNTKPHFTSSNKELFRNAVRIHLHVNGEPLDYGYSLGIPCRLPFKYRRYPHFRVHSSIHDSSCRLSSMYGWSLSVCVDGSQAVLEHHRSFIPSLLVTQLHVHVYMYMYMDLDLKSLLGPHFYIFQDHMYGKSF